MTMSERSNEHGKSGPALEKTVSADEAGVTADGAGSGSGRLSAGTKLGRYEIVEFIGGGGMGWVYRAKDTELEREVAIKVVQPTVAGPKGRERLLAEARAMAKLRHRAVVPVFDVGEYAGGVYVAMALVKGGTLHDWMHAEARPWRQVVARFLEAGRGLVAAHAAGIVHRDFKPRNVLLGEGGEVMVADFGIASASVDVSEGDGAANDDGTGRAVTSIVGTPAYMAPEQAAGQAVDARADQYSFCVSLWEGLHGQRPQEAETRTQGVLLAGATAAPKSRRRVPGWLTDAVARGFAPAPEKRWPTLAALLDQLERGLRRRRRVVAFSAGVAVAAVVVVGLMRVRHAAPDPCPAPAGVEWGGEARAKVERAFAATGVAFAREVSMRVLPSLDAYDTAWRGRMIASCRATHVEHTQSLALLDRRGECLRERRAHMAALVDTFHFADRAVVAGAVAAVAALPSIEACDRGDSLLSRPAPPQGRGKDVEKVQAELGQARDLWQRGRFRDALHAVEASVASARRTGWPPLLAEALAHLASLRGEMRMPSDSVLSELALAAGRARDDVAALVAQTEMYALEVQRGNSERVAAIEPVLTGTLARVDGETAIKLRATLLMAKGSPARALELLDAAQALATTPAQRAEVLGARAAMERDASAALRLYEQAKAEAVRAYGAGHPALGKWLLAVAAFKYKAGDLDGAEKEWKAAGSLYAQAYGEADTVEVADYLQQGAIMVEYRHRLAEAEEMLRRAIKIYSEAGMLQAEAQAERNLANVLGYWDARGAEGAPHYRRALELMEAAQGRESIEYAEVEASLGIFLASDDCAAGVPYLEHARQALAPVRSRMLASVAGQLGDCVAKREPALAAGYYELALTTCRDRGCAPGHSAQIAFAQGRLLVADRATRDRGLLALHAALDAFLAIDDREDAVQVEKEIARWRK
jgi:tetratricopeptide (TPR) repeat protein